MKLKNPIQIKVYTENSPEPELLEYSYIDVSYIIRFAANKIHAQITGFPSLLTISEDLKYDDNLSVQQLDRMLLEYLEPDPQEKLQSLFPKSLKSDPNGPGSILSNMIASMGIKTTENCSCKKHAIEMNEKGIEWCEQNIDTILGWLKEESSKRKLPFVESIARLIVKRAISQSKRLKNKQYAK
jgi:hypothetical protein